MPPQISYAFMLSKQDRFTSRPTGSSLRRGWMATLLALPGLLLALTVLLTGCLSPLTKHAAAFSNAANVVIDHTEDAYELANRLHDDVVVLDAVAAFDADPAWDPHKPLKVLLTPEQLAGRISVLDALKLYAASLASVTNGQPSKDLKHAATEAGGSMASVAGSAATIFGQGTSSAATLSPAVADGISAAVLALGESLSARKVKREVPQRIIAIDPTITALCRFLETDVTILTRQAHNDFEQEIEHENTLIRRNGTKLSPVEHRNEIALMLTLVRRERRTDELLQRLHVAIERLALTHTALAAAAQKKDAKSFRQKLAELVAAGTSLGHSASSSSSHTD